MGVLEKKTVVRVLGKKKSLKKCQPQIIETSPNWGEWKKGGFPRISDKLKNQRLHKKDEHRKKGEFPFACP